MAISIIALIASGVAIYFAFKKESVVTFKNEIDDIKRIDELEKDANDIKNIIQEHQEILRKSKA